MLDKDKAVQSAQSAFQVEIKQLKDSLLQLRQNLENTKARQEDRVQQRRSIPCISQPNTPKYDWGAKKRTGQKQPSGSRNANAVSFANKEIQQLKASLTSTRQDLEEERSRNEAAFNGRCFGRKRDKFAQVGQHSLRDELDKAR